MIKFNSSEIASWKDGSSDIAKMYVGNNLRYIGVSFSGSPEPPTFDGKLKLTYSDSSVYTAACGSSSILRIKDVTDGTGEKSAITSAEIGSCVTSIGDDAFRDCSSLVSIGLPSDLNSIGIAAFRGCSSLTSIGLPSEVTSIGINAFYRCSSLTSITINATTPPTLGNTNALNDTNNCPIYVPAASVDTYKAARNWSTYASRIQAIPS